MTVKKEARARSETPTPHHRILSIEVEGGLLDGTVLELADGLNCIIGGRGTGKTTVVEFMRYALGLMPNSDASRHKSLTRMIQANLRHGSVRVAIETRHGVRYNVVRAQNEPPRVLDSKGSVVHVSLERDLVFGADIYSLNEIEDIATDSARQLVLLDKFVESEMRAVRDEMRGVLRELDSSGSELVREERDIADLEETATELPALEEKLAALKETEGPNAERINEAHVQKALRDKERRMIELLEKEALAIRGEIEQSVSSWTRRLTARIDTEVVEGRNRKIVQKVAKAAAELASTMSELAGDASRRAEAVTTAGRKLLSELEEAHATQEAEYGKLIAQSEDARARAAERTKVHRRHAEVTSAKRALDEHIAERRKRRDRRSGLLKKLASLRDQRFTLRRSVAENLTRQLSPLVRVSVLQAGDHEAYRSILGSMLSGSKVRGLNAVVESIVTNVPPVELVRMAREGDESAFAARSGIAPDRAPGILGLLSDPSKTDALCRLETVELEDVPRIELLDGKTHKDSSELSAGQRCTTILSIVLLESGLPLIIDQPEDNLDNAFIFRVVVKTLRDVKKVRQIIFVTHNPNIPVLAEAERVFEMASDGQRARLEAHGSVDDLKKEITNLLEGGEEAFLERWRRYGY